MNPWVVGLIASDGHNTGFGWSISQNIDDVDVLVHVKSLYSDIHLNISFKTENRYGNKPQVTISRKSKEDSIKLIHLGVPIGNKTFSLSFPHYLSEEDTWLYLQGFLEGDGSISIEDYKYPRIGITSNNQWCSSCKEWLINKKIKSYISEDGENAFCLYIHNTQGCKDFLKGIYKNSTILKMARKYVTAMKVITLLDYHEKILFKKNHDRELYHNVFKMLNKDFSVLEISNGLNCSQNYVNKVKFKKLGSQKEKSVTKIEEIKILLKEGLKKSDIKRKDYGIKLINKAFIELYGSFSYLKDKKIDQIRGMIVSGIKVKDIIKKLKCSEKTIVRERKYLKEINKKGEL